MNELSKENFMTVKEVAKVLNVSRQLISEKIKELFPNKPVVNGVQSLLNEKEVTAIKLNIERNPHLPSTTVEGMPKTELEKELLIFQAMQFQAEKVKRLELMLSEAKPKIEFFDAVTESKDAVSIGEAAKVLDLGYGSITLFQKLRNERVLMSNNIPYQRYIDEGYFRVIEQRFTIPTGETKINLKTVVYQTGLDFIRKLLSKKELS